MEQLYTGLSNDVNGGMTHLGRIVKDGWLFGLLPETEDCAGCNTAQMGALYEKIYTEWGKYAHLPSRLPEELKERHTKIYLEAIASAKANGWNPELGDDD